MLELVEFHIVEHCNLNCKSCMHFSPLAEEKFVDYEEFKRDVKSLYRITKGRIKTINILGGEPLLHRELIPILNYTRRYFKESEIRLISNGILLNSQKEVFWQCLRYSNIHLSVTKYPIGINYQNITRLTQKYGVRYSFYADEKEYSQWHFPLDVEGKQDPVNGFKNCRKGNNCTNINIVNGKLYMCPVVSNIRYFNNYFKKDLAVSSEDFLVLREVSSIQEIYDYMSKPIPFCRYCDIENRTFNNRWEVSKREIMEWV